MVKTLSTAERPRERCLKTGARCLSFRECLALILNSGPPKIGSLGLAGQLLDRPGAGLSETEQERAFFIALEVSGSAHLSGIRGLGEAGQARLLAAFELGRRYALHRERQLKRLVPAARPQTLSFLAETALTRITAELRNESQEWLGFIPCFRGGEIGEFCLVERGVRTHVNTEAIELFARVLALRPEGIVLAHNHPSGDLTPSGPDQEITLRVSRLARQLGILLVGHWIVAPHGEFWLEPR